jgi:hypothetical protein
MVEGQVIVMRSPRVFWAHYRAGSRNFILGAGKGRERGTHLFKGGGGTSPKKNSLRGEGDIPQEKF